MPQKNTAKKVSVPKKIKEETEEFVNPTPTNKPTSNILLILLVLISFFAGYLFFKVRSLEQGKQATDSAQNGNQAATVSPLTTDNLKKYAKDLRLDQKKFNSCLDNNQKKDAVNADLSQGTSLGVRGTPGFFINGKFLGGAFPFEFFKEIIDKEINGTASTNCTDYSEDLQQYCGSTPDKPFNPTPKNIDLGTVPPKGSSSAKVTLVEYSDFQCPYCIRSYPTVKQILQTYPNNVKFVYKQYPLTNIHPLAQKAAEASLCAADQDKFWEYHDKLFEAQISQ